MMVTDYDAPRIPTDELPANESLEALQARNSEHTQRPLIDLEDDETHEVFDIPSVTLEEEFTVYVVPEQGDEFTCSSCFLVRHRSQISRWTTNDLSICLECDS